MGLQTISVETLDLAVRTVARELRTRERSSACWRNLSENELWQELASCILGSAVSFEQATFAIQLLKDNDLLRLPDDRTALNSFEWHIAKALSARAAADFQATQRYRFPFRRARHLRRTAEAIYFDGGCLRGLLENSEDPRVARANLVRLGAGVGPKQASLFLRNVGYADFAVLDRHVARFMLIRTLLSCEPRLRTLPQYEKIEEVFFTYADAIGIPVADLDLAVWIVARVIKRGSSA